MLHYPQLPQRNRAQKMKRAKAMLMAAAMLMALTAAAEPANAQPQDDWQTWLAETQAEAATQGIPPWLFEAALAGATPDPRVLKADANQPEFIRPIWDYLATAVSPQRIQQGQRALATHKNLLAQLRADYGIPPQILVAIWGIETNYGANKGGFHIPRALATLAYASDRETFARRQLFAALRLIREGIAPAADLHGSWAGAIGHMQFLPTTYETHAIDHDQDGRRDLIANEQDALASAANYLRASGWQAGEPWSMEVTLPAGFDHSLAAPDTRKSGRGWERLGLRAATPRALPAEESALLLPAGHRGPAFLLYDNFAVIKRYNPSTAYALAISRLADCIKGCEPLAAAWPTEDGALRPADITALQTRLTALGYDTGGIDGIIGPNTRAALRQWQRDNAAVVDGYVNRDLLQRLQAEQ